MAKDDDILRDAIIGTEKEIFGDAFGKEELTLDETGDRSVEAMGEGLEGQHEPEDEDDEESGDEQEASEAKKDDEKGEGETKEATEAQAKEEAKEPEPEPRGRVPSGRLREEAEKTRAAQAERDALKAQLDAEKSASQKAIADLNAKFEGVLAAFQRQGAQPQPKPTEQAKGEEPPDLFENPTAFVDHLQKGFDAKVNALAQQIREQRINMSMALSRSRHGEAFDAAFGALKSLDASNPDNRLLVQRIIEMPDPGEAVMTWHKRNEAIREVGDDPSAYKARIADEARKTLMADPEFRRQLIEELRGEASTGDGGRPRTEVRLPRSLNRAGGGNGRAPNDLDIFDGSERATFDSAWTT
jgi:hypothetical protein